MARFSLVVCSVDRARLDECVARYRAAFADEPFDLIVIDDARSLAEGYNRGIARARGANIVFSHDDAFPISSAFADRLAAHLEQVDVVGIAGATAALSGFWGYAGQPHTHGHVVAAAPEGTHVDLLVWGAAGRRVDGIRLLDGCMIAARRDVAAALGFDAQRFDGFHLYDADFSLRASAAGYAVSVVSDITVYHRSTGDFDADWHRYHQMFLAAHAARLDRVAPQPRRVARIPFSGIAVAAKEIDEQRIAELTPRLREPGVRQP
ncbi:MAG TPA: glycosyltransferase [Casimicrobiaceae bacterium]|nr:glycosyltransferase [Casimicrobiaceae bacterium]